MFHAHARNARRSVAGAALILIVTACGGDAARDERAVASELEDPDSRAAEGQMVSVFDSAPAEMPNPTERVREALPPRTEAAADPARANEEGLDLFARRTYAESAHRFAQAVAAAPNNAAYRNNYGWALFKAGNMPEAERELLEVLRLNPDREIAYANLGEVRLARGDVVGGTAAYQRFLELNHDPARQRIAQEKLRNARQR